MIIINNENKNNNTIFNNKHDKNIISNEFNKKGTFTIEITETIK